MQVILNYKSFYEAFKIGVIDDGYTSVARLLFFPLFDPDHMALCDETGELYEVDNRNANDWSKGLKQIPRLIREAAGKKDTLQVLIEHFNSDSFKNALIEIREDDMDESIIKLVNKCELSARKKDILLKYYKPASRYEFYARVFQLALIGDNKVSSDAKMKSASDTSDESVVEFNTIVRRKKPETHVPPKVQKPELKYVRQLYSAYQDASGRTVRSPKDLDEIKYREHFNRQRKNYYMAETIFRETRDSIGPDENDPFEALKDEMEEGTSEARGRDYPNAVIKIDAVLEQASRVPIARWIDIASFNWIGPSEKKGVCHILVNEDRMKWVEEA